MVAILISIVELPLAKLVEESIKILKFLQKFPEIFYSYINHTQLLINHLNSPIILWGFGVLGLAVSIGRSGLAFDNDDDEDDTKPHLPKPQFKLK